MSASGAKRLPLHLDFAAREIAAQLKRWRRGKARAQHRQVTPLPLEGEAELIGNRLIRCVLLGLGMPTKNTHHSRKIFTKRYFR